MKIRYRVVGELKKVVDPPQGQVELAAGSSIADLAAKLGVPENILIIFMAGGHKKKRNDLLEEGEEVVLVPPAIGG